MPTFRHPSGSTLYPEPPACSSHCDPGVSGAHIYLALAAVAVFVAVRLATARFARLQPAPRWAPTTQLPDIKGHSTSTSSAPGPECRKDSAASYTRWDSAVRSPCQARDQREHHPQQAVWTAGFSPAGVGAGPGPCQPAGQPRAMEGFGEEAPRKDQPGPASRGVSTSSPSAPAPVRHQNPPPFSARPGPSDGRRRETRPPQPSPPTSSPRRHSGSSDGSGNGRSKGKGPMAGQSSWTTPSDRPESLALPLFGEEASHSRFGGGVSPAPASSLDDPGPTDRDYSAQHTFSRLPLLPPLASSALAGGGSGYQFEERGHSFALSIPPELDMSFIRQPSPDYAGPSTSADIYSSSSLGLSTASRQRSSAKGAAVGIPIPPTTSAGSSTETMTSADTFSPSSYPPTSPLLPPPPPGHEFPYEYEFVGGPGGPGILSSVQEIDIHGEVMSLTDDGGHSWKRHTRVYGGGVCLACAAAGDEGGFYGDKVPLEDRR